MTSRNNVALACAWKVRGELVRFQQAYPQLAQLYSRIVVVMPPDSDPEIVQTLQEFPLVAVVLAHNWAWGRHTAIQQAGTTGADYVHYVDFERMLRWFETAAHEVPLIVTQLQQTDCLIIGRTRQAFDTHAQALQQTETIINTIFSHLLGQSVDLGGGSRGFSLRAVQFLMRNSPPGNAIGTDAEWPMLLHRAGFNVQFIAADGLAWEVPDHYKSYAVDGAAQRAAAYAYDADASRWALRVQTALEIVEAGLDAATRPLNN
ncbi:MAG: hypothetical protein H0X37_08355 [Herpetosiphonaceae bacterium]|nr:hypothetical protein [Herpetosiphonaceae bacterium]